MLCKAIPSHAKLKKNYSEPCRAIPSHAELFRAMQSYSESCRAIPSHAELFRAMQSYSEPCIAIPSHAELFRVMQSYSEPCKAIPSHAELNKAIPSHPKLFCCFACHAEVQVQPKTICHASLPKLVTLPGWCHRCTGITLHITLCNVCALLGVSHPDSKYFALLLSSAAIGSTDRHQKKKV